MHACRSTLEDPTKPGDEITTIEGLPATVDKDLHPMQQAWLDHDVAQCGYCQPGQIMAAVALVKEVQAQGRAITESDLDAIRNVCRCGTYFRVRDAIEAGAKAMAESAPRAVTPPPAAVPPATAGTPVALPGNLPTTGANEVLEAAGAAALAAAGVVAAKTRGGAGDPA